ncbi:MAG: hypothetical protein R3F11_18370 [Verrucomicrobiales bacterium]
MKPHPLRIEEAQAAVAPVQLRRRDLPPIRLFIALPIGGTSRLIPIVIQPLRLPQPRSTAQNNARKRLRDLRDQPVGHPAALKGFPRRFDRLPIIAPGAHFFDLAFGDSDHFFL